MPCWRSTASAAFKSGAARDGMMTANSMCGTVSAIRHMPMRSVIGSVGSGRPRRDPVSQPKHPSTLGRAPVQDFLEFGNGIVCNENP
jgi:hypothetical protein